MSVNSTGQKRGRYRIAILVVIWLLYVINYFDKMAVLNLLPYIRKDLGLSPATVGFAASIFFFAYALAQLPAGMLADKFGPKKVMYFAITVFTLFTFLTGKINSLFSFMAVRTGLGFGEGFHFVPSIRTISDWFPAKEKGRATSFFTTSWTVAPAIGAIVITTIAASWGWRGVFATLSVPGLLGFIALWLVMKDTPEQAYAVGRISKEELDYITEGATMSAKADKPKARYRDVAGDPQLWVITAIVFIKTFVYWGAATWLSSFLVEQHGFNITTMGLLSALPFAVGFIGQMTSGWMLDKVTKSKAKPLLIAAFAGLAAILYFVPLVPKGNIPLLIIVLVIQGFFIVFYDGPIYVFIQMRYPKELVGTVTGVTQMIGQFGSFIAPKVAGFLIVTGTGVSNFTSVFHMFMYASIVGLVLSLIIKENPLKQEAKSIN